MKRLPFPFPRVFDDPEMARRYAVTHGKYGARWGRTLARELAQRGFTGSRILDVGTGSGEVPIELARAFPESRVIGVDLSEPLLEMARDAVKREGLAERVSFERRDAGALGFDDDSFDVVVSLSTLHVAEDPIAMLNETERVLAPGGHFSIITLRRSLLGLFERAIGSSFTPAEVEELALQSSLRPWEVRAGILWLRLESA